MKKGKKYPLWLRFPLALACEPYRPESVRQSQAPPNTHLNTRNQQFPSNQFLVNTGVWGGGGGGGLNFFPNVLNLTIGLES